MLSDKAHTSILSGLKENSSMARENTFFFFTSLDMNVRYNEVWLTERITIKTKAWTKMCKINVNSLFDQKEVG